MKTYEIIYSNVHATDVDRISLFNISGIFEINLRVGTHNENQESPAWSFSSQQDYPLSYQTLNHVSTSGRYIEVSDTFSESELIGQSLMLWNGSNYVEQWNVVENFENVIELNSSAPTPSGSDELRLFKLSESIDVSSFVGGSNHGNYSITFKSPDTTNIVCIGEVIFGQKVDLSEHITNVEDAKVISNFSKVESGFGLDYTPYSKEGNVVRKEELSLFLNRQDGSYSKVKELLTSIYQNDKPFGITREHSDGEKEDLYGLLDGSFSIDQDGFNTLTATFPVVYQDFKPYSISEFVNNPPIINSMEADNTYPEAGETVTFTASATDPEGTSLSYSWDFGDTNSDTGSSVTHSYSEVGEYKVELTVTDADGGSTQKSMLMYISKSAIDSYTVVSNPSSPSVGSEFTLEVDAKDSSGSIVTHDSSMEVALETDTNSEKLDSSGGSAVSEPYSKTLTRGEVDFDFVVINSGSSSTFTFTDLVDRRFTHTIQLSICTDTLQTSVVDDSAPAGYACCIEKTSDDHVHIIYYRENGANVELMHAEHDTASWSTEIIETHNGINPHEDESALDVVADSSDNLHVAYYDKDANEQRYAIYSSGSWSTELVSTIDGGLGNALVVQDNGDIDLICRHPSSNTVAWHRRSGGSWAYQDEQFLRDLPEGIVMRRGTTAGDFHVISGGSSGEYLSYNYWNGSSFMNTSGGEIIVSGDEVGINDMEIDSNNVPHVMADILGAFGWNGSVYHFDRTGGSWNNTEVITRDVDSVSLEIEEDDSFHVFVPHSSNNNIEYWTYDGNSWTMDSSFGSINFGFSDNYHFDSVIAQNQLFNCFYDDQGTTSNSDDRLMVITSC